MRVSALRMAFSHRTAAVASMLAVIGLLGACSGLIKKTPDACSVTIAPREITVPVNATASVIGTAFDCSGNSIAKRAVTFSSSNSAIASVTPAGQIIGVSVGTAIVSASASGKSGEASVTVTPERVATVTLTPATITLRKTNIQQFTAVAKNSQGTVINGITFQWASSNSSVASVDNSGRAIALTVGNVVISATADGQTGSSSVSVTEVPIGSCFLTPASQKLLVNQQGALTVSLKDTAGNALSSTGRALSWSSDNEIIATVSLTGIVTGKKAGTAKITATVPENTSVSCPANVEITDPKIKSVVISPSSALLRLGVPRQYTVALLDSNGLALPAAGRTVSWRNVTPAIASVTSSGIVTGISLGTGRVAVDAEGAVDTVSFNVTKIPVQFITISPTSASVVQGQPKQFTTTLTDTAGTIVTDRQVDWTTSDATKALVSTTGLVNTLASGTVTITAITTGGSGQQLSASATLTITPVPVDTIIVVSTTFTLAKNANSPFAITLRDAAGNELRNRSVQVTSDHPDIAGGIANAAATQVNVSGVAIGTATLTLQAVNANNQNEGKATKVVVTVTAPIP